MCRHGKTLEARALCVSAGNFPRAQAEPLSKEQAATTKGMPMRLFVAQKNNNPLVVFLHVFFFKQKMGMFLGL